MGQRNLITVKMELDQLSEGLCAWVFAVKGSWTHGLGIQALAVLSPSLCQEPAGACRAELHLCARTPRMDLQL